MNILGLSCGHNANVCLVVDGVVVAHYEKERLTRRKNDSGLVDEIARRLLADYNMTIDDIDVVASSCPVWPEHGMTGRLVAGTLYDSVYETSSHRMVVLGRSMPAVMVPHHLGHAAYAYYMSGFDDADIVVVDAGGNFTATVIAHGTQHSVAIDIDLAPGNLGSMWSMASRDIFGDLLAAGKVMGLAPYGEAVDAEMLFNRYAVEILGYLLPAAMWNEAPLPGFPSDLVGVKDGWRDVRIQNLAASLQEVTNRSMLGLATVTRSRTGRRNLCVSGGVALNGIANEQLIRFSGYSNVYIPPAANDGGLAIGFAAYVFALLTGARCSTMDPRYLGRTYSQSSMLAAVNRLAHSFDVKVFDRGAMAEEVVSKLTNGEVIALWSGRAESGPRALGHRSIIGDPRSPTLRDRLNLQIKNREPFRPFAPAILQTSVGEYCDVAGSSPYMLRVVPLRRGVAEAMQAVRHVDGTTRPQTVEISDDATGVLVDILRAMETRVGLPAVVNTSFNLRGEPLVDSPSDAAMAFESAPLDAMVLDQWLVSR